jgi:UDP-N-acetylmuramyl pentapeptide phosphotransferase/UDP-N-acetylglucosamine-1-phosphate transferase
VSRAFIFIAGVVVLLSFSLTGYLSLPSSRFRLLDHPNERSLHTRLTPRTGGLAIVTSLFAGLAVALSFEWWRGFPASDGLILSRANLWLVSQVLLIVIVSLADDVRGLPVALRLSVHAIAALGVVLGAGFMMQTFGLPGIGSVSLGWAALPLSVLLIIWMTNLYNFMDGIDGIAGGMTAIGFGFLGYIAWTGGHLTMARLSILVVTAAIGFLAFNLPPARIFMGDVGSTALGFLAGALALQGVHDGLFDIWAPILIFSPFVVDATATLLGRLVRAQRIWRPHREHYYQRLVLAGWSHRKTAFSEYSLMIATGVSAVVYVRAGNQWRLAILLGWTALYFLIAYSIQRLVERRKLESVASTPAAEVN